jgi:D-glycero-alpha-D-manno-heptose 1-phosphate guanylyltransferase
MMDAIVLAGGFGTRLRQVVPDLPKPMAPVGGRPFLEVLLTQLARKGFRRVVLSLGYLAHKVVEHFGGQYANMELVYAIETTPLGTGGAIRRALGLCQTDHVFVLNGDTYLDLEADEIENHWQDHHNPIIVAREIPDTSRYGRLRTDHGSIVGFSDKGHQGPGLINAGCYVLPKPILDETRCGESFSLEADWLPGAVMRQRFDVFVSRRLFIDIGIPEDYARAQTVLSGVCV